jgi:hypothetical protein
MSHLRKFSYQQLQYCPQRNVPSISKEKHFNSTVSRYDPRTKRTTRIINCVPYDELIAKDSSKCCFPEPPPPPFPPITTQTIYIDLDTTGGYNPPFSATVTGTGYFIFGYDGIPHFFSASTPTLFQFNPVYDPENNTSTTVSIHTSDITYLDLSGNSLYEIYNLDITTARTLQTYIAKTFRTGLNFNITGNPNLLYLDLYESNFNEVNYFDFCRNITYIDVRNNFIDQTTANDIARRLVSNGTRNGTLKISAQFGADGQVDINTTYFNTLRNSLGWTIT